MVHQGLAVERGRDRALARPRREIGSRGDTASELRRRAVSVAQLRELGQDMISLAAPPIVARRHHVLVLGHPDHSWLCNIYDPLGPCRTHRLQPTRQEAPMEEFDGA